MKRKVIIHKHLFKNAGTTFDWSLKKNFGNAFCDHRDDIPMRKEGEKYLINYLEKNPEIKALSSHHIRFTFTQHPKIQLIPVYILRHPIERIKSVYKFEKIQPPETSLGAKKAKNMDFKTYVSWRMQPEIPATIRNFQTRYMAGAKHSEPLTNYDLGNAINEFKNCPFMGLVEHFEDSMEMFKNEFKKLGIEIKISYKPQNVNQPINEVDYEKRTDAILNELGDLAEIVLRNNEYDIHIYKLARQKLNRYFQESS